MSTTASLHVHQCKHVQCPQPIRQLHSVFGCLFRSRVQKVMLMKRRVLPSWRGMGVFSKNWVCFQWVLGLAGPVLKCTWKHDSKLATAKHKNILAAATESPMTDHPHERLPLFQDHIFINTLLLIFPWTWKPPQRLCPLAFLAGPLTFLACPLTF